MLSKNMPALTESTLKIAKDFFFVLFRFKHKFLFWREDIDIKVETCGLEELQEMIKKLEKWEKRIRNKFSKVADSFIFLDMFSIGCLPGPMMQFLKE